VNRRRAAPIASALLLLLLFLTSCQLLIEVRRPRAARDFFVAPAASGGSNGNPGTIGAPFLTINYALGFLAPSDTLYIRAGTYAEELFDTIPGGTSWSAPVTVKAYPSEVVTLRPTAGACGSPCFVVNFGQNNGANTRYIILDGVILDGASTLYDGVKIENFAHHIRVQNCEIKNALGGNGLLDTGSGSGTTGGGFNELLNNHVHNNGSSFHYHGFYISTANNIVDGNHVHDNASFGIHMYHEGVLAVNNNIVRNNNVHDHSNPSSGAIILADGDGNHAYNNLVWNTAGLGIQLMYAGTNSRVTYNTIYGNGTGVYIHSDATGAILRNNIIYSNSTNVTNVGGVGSVDGSNLIGVNPQFVNAPTNFHVQGTSPAIGAGTPVAGITTDKDGVPRPAAPTIGAYETASSFTPGFPTVTDFPSTPVIDTFNRAAGPVGPNYQTIYGDTFTTNGTQLTPPSTTYTIMLWTPGSFGAFHEAWAEWPGAPACCGNSTLLVFAGSALSGVDQWRVYLNRQVGLTSKIEVGRLDAAGSYAVMAGPIDLGIDVPPNTAFGIRVASGPTLSVYWKYIDGLWYRVYQGVQASLPAGAGRRIGLGGLAPTTIENLGGGTCCGAVVAPSEVGRFGTIFPKQ